VVAKVEVAEQFQQIDDSRGKDDAEANDEGDVLDLGVVVWKRPCESNEDNQGDDVDEEPDRLEEDGVGDLVVRHVLHRTEKDEEVCPAGKKSPDNSCLLHFSGLVIFAQLRELVCQSKFLFSLLYNREEGEGAESNVEKQYEANVDGREPLGDEDCEDEGSRVEDQAGEKKREGHKELFQRIHLFASSDP